MAVIPTRFGTGENRTKSECVWNECVKREGLNDTLAVEADGNGYSRQTENES